MREIKFRGKQLDGKGWAFGHLVKMWGAWHIIDWNDENTAYAVDPATVGQYTGLKDKNGKDIYEWDVAYYYKCDGKTRRGIVKYYEDGFNIFQVGSAFEDCSLRGLGSLGIEIIGNIHDNPDLLKTE